MIMMVKRQPGVPATRPSCVTSVRQWRMSGGKIQKLTFEWNMYVDEWELNTTFLPLKTP